MANFKKTTTISVLGLGLLTLAACQSGRVIQTEDGSADYKSERLLPPLKKASTASASVQSSTDELGSTAAQSQPVAAANQNEGSQPVFNGAQITGVSGKSRLVILSSIDDAWSPLMARLIESDITVFSRNKAAGKVSIGCTDIEADSAQRIKSGRWSILNRKKQKVAEYCALKVADRKGRTVVSVLDREGKEVPADKGRVVLNRILEN